MRNILDSRAVMQKPDEGGGWVAEEVVKAVDGVSWQARDVLSQWWEAFWDVGFVGKWEVVHRKKPIFDSLWGDVA